MNTIRVLIVLSLTSFAVDIGFAADPAAKDRELIVHEWGTFTSVAGEDGVALEWRPLAEPSDLPSFVYQIGGLPKGLRQYSPKSGRLETVRMETPVVYFYAKESLDVSVRVRFPRGQITEWYPQARDTGAGIDWGLFKVMPGAQVPFPTERGPSHYYPARETDASPIRVCGYNGHQYEKFLFYRGIGTFALPLSCKLENANIRLIPFGRDAIPGLLVFEKRNGLAGYRIFRSLRKEMIIQRPTLQEVALDKLYDDLARMLKREGLYPKEAKAMVTTWKDQWFGDGLRVFYILPGKVAEQVLPITIKPEPAKLVRVLVGQSEILTPEFEAQVRDRVLSLADPFSSPSPEVVAEIRQRGRFTETVLRQLQRKTGEVGLKDAIAQLLLAMER